MLYKNDKEIISDIMYNLISNKIMTFVISFAILITSSGN